jgi:hypothetical protein
MQGRKMVLKTCSREEFGDFQTPSELVSSVLDALYRDGRSWLRALEPTCGLGSFIKGLAALSSPPREIQGIEVQPRYVANARGIAKDYSKTRVQVHLKDTLRHNLNELVWTEEGPLLTVGNPPWVTNSRLGVLRSLNLPVKKNFKNLKGLDARTGAANFDIAEYIWLKLISELVFHKPTIALLCKTQVARNVLNFASKTELPLSNAAIYRIDAKKFFGAAVDACLFSVDVGSATTNYDVRVFPSLSAVRPDSIMGMARGSLVSHSGDYERLKFLDGKCGFTWRQGLKHDLSSLMEIEKTEDGFVNRKRQKVDIENDYLYPMLKSSDLQATSGSVPRLHVIVPQKGLGDDTSRLERKAPKLWKYLSSHISAFNSRKSTIYENRPSFSIFGIGEYSFSLYKVAVSGLYKKVNFKPVPPWNGKPVMLDDTCYLIPCDSAEQACVLTCLLNHPTCLEFIHSLVFMDSKRPVTKKVLQRIDLRALLQSVDRAKLASSVQGELQALGVTPSRKMLELEEYVTGEINSSAASQLQLSL